MKIRHRLNNLRKWVGEPSEADGNFVRQTQVYLASHGSIRIFYALLLVIALRVQSDLFPITEQKRFGIFPPKLFAFLSSLSVAQLHLILFSAPMLCLAAVAWPAFRALRVATVLVFTLAVTIQSSFGPNHVGLLSFVWCAAVFACLPTWPQQVVEVVSRKSRQVHLQIYWFGLLAYLTPYFMSGLWKVGWGGIYQSFFDDVSLLSPKSMSYMVSNYVQTSSTTPILATFIIDHPLIGFVSLLAIGVVFEIFCLLPLFRPSHWRINALLIAFFHIVSFWVFQIYFSDFTLGAIFFLYYVPFYRPRRLIEARRS